MAACVLLRALWDYQDYRNDPNAVWLKVFAKLYSALNHRFVESSSMVSLESDFFLGLFGAILFRFRNEQTDYQNWIFGFVIGLFFSQGLYVYGRETVGELIWAISAIGLGVTYLLRFNKKFSKAVIDFLKPAGVVLVIIYPITFYALLRPEGEYWAVVRALTLPLLAVIYIYDRWILKKENMKRKFVIVLVAQTVLILLFFTFAFVKKAEADRQRELAVWLSREAREQRAHADRMRAQLDSLKNSNLRP